MERHLDDWIDAYLKYTDDTEPRKSFRLWCAISCIAAVLQRKCVFRLGKIAFYPNFYIVLIGPPAARKGTAMEPVREFLDALGVATAADESSRQKLVSKLMSSPAQVVYDDGRVDFHSSLTVFSPELTVFLSYENAELLGILCDWYDCRSRFVYDTYQHGEQEVVNVWLNLLGGTTPTLLQSSLPRAGVGSGFTSRTIFVYEEDKGKIVICPKMDAGLQEALLHDLEAMKSLKGEFRVETGFLQAYGEWRLESEANPPFRDQALDYYLQRRQVHLIKLCLVYSISRSDDMVLRKVDLRRAEKTLNEVEQKMPRTFEGLGQNPLAEVQARIIREIALKKKLYIGELLDLFYKDVSNREMAEILATLQERRFCSIEPKSRLVKYIGDRKEKKDGLLSEERDEGRRKDEENSG